MSVEQMRDHFNRVAEHRLRQGEWTEADKAECNARIKDALASGDAGEIKRWADWLAGIVVDERLPGYRVVGAPVHPSPPAATAPGPASCSSCRHRTRPGILLKGEPDFTYCGGGRGDLPPAYGEGHPLRRLPADKGNTCLTWSLA